jgi:hypothetical protein
MSFDLGVWYSESPLSDKEAGDTYLSLCNGVRTATKASPAVGVFYRELTNRYPELGSVSEHEIDSCPWNCAFDKSDGHVLICIAWSRAEEMFPIVVTMAGKQGLVCYDAQADKVYLPTRLKSPH